LLYADSHFILIKYSVTESVVQHNKIVSNNATSK
jgi:hypothetical protein